MADEVDRADARSVFRLPHPALRDYLTGYHGYRYDVVDPNIHYGLPTTALTMVLALAQPIDVGWLGDEAGRGRYWAMASGLGVEPAVIHQHGRQQGVMFDVTPLGARALFGTPAAPLSGQLVSFEDLLGRQATRVHEAVASVEGWPRRFRALDRALLELLAAFGRHRPIPDRTLDRAWQRLHASRGRLPISRLADEVGWSRRQLTHRFGREFGISPKQTARLVRFNTTRPLVVARDRSLADVAASCGYADQAHLTREWRDLAGLPPTAWIEAEFPFVQDIETID